MRIATSNDVEEEGINRLINAERGITRSRRTLIVLSENYLLNHAKDFEDSLSQTISKEESNRLLIVQIAPLDTRLLPNWLKGIFLVDLSNQAQNAGTLKRLAQILREPLSSRPDYKSYITEHTIDFTGRDWVFRAIDDWLARSDGSRFFLVTGEPGSGKTAIASRLCQFAQGVVSPPDGLTHVTSGFLSAIHFCSAQNAEWISPYAFARSLALQLTEHYPAYAFALTKIEVNLEVQEPQKGQVVGVSIGQIGLSMLSPEEDFRVLVLEPLAALFQNQPDLQVIILVDALDESLDYKGETNIVSLLALADNFPPGVRFLVTTRSTTEILSLLRSSRLEETSLSSGEGLIFSEADIRAYASHRLELVAEPERRQLADQVAGSARGSFLSARLALDTQIADYDRQQVLALIELIRADLLDLTVDALVHGVGLDLGRGGHLGVQLIQRGGSELAEQLQHERRLAPAEVLITDAGLLPTHYLLHVCDEDNLGRHSVQSVTQAVSSALATAESLSDVRSLAFPSLGTSAAGLDPTDTAPEILKAVVSHLTQNSHLQRVIFALNDEATYRAYVDAYRSLGGVVEEVRQAFNVYRLLISTKPDQVAVGQHVHLQVLLQPAPVSSRDEVVEVPTNVVEVYCSVSAEGLRVYGPDRAAIPIVPRIHELVFANFELEAHLPGQRSFTVELFIEDPQSGRLSISKTSKQVIVEFPTTDEERPPLLPALKVRVAPLPDFVLEVDANPTDTPFSSHHLTYRLTSRLPFLQLEHQKVGEVALRETDLVCIKTMIRQAVQQATNVQPEDSYEHMLSIGAYLFDRLFPADSAKDFRDMYWKVADRLTTWLIVEDGIVKDGVTWLPWELVVPYRAGAMAPPRFLGERYHLSRWIEGLGSSLGLYNEVPIGEVALAHYKIDGIVQVVKPEIPVFGLHILRHADQVTSRDIAPRDGPAIAHSPEEEMPQVRLDLWFKRPVVTLGILTQVDNDLTNADVDNWPLPERARTFLRNGASAVVGPWWPTSEDADQVFWPAFYDLLARRVSLGEAVWRARLAVWGMLPHRPDWLAYALFGDPRARPYWPQPSEGYTALECLNPDESLLPIKTYYFRVSIRNRPPVWHKDRLVFAENLPQEPRAIFLAPGLQLATSEPIEMVPYGRTMVQATVAMRAREAGVFQITVRLLDGEERLQSLRLKLVVGETGTTGEELN